MKGTTLALLAGCAFFAVSCGTTNTYQILSKSNTQTGGTAKFTQKGDEVVMKLDVTNLTPGIHAVHIHEKGDCSAADEAFKKKSEIWIKNLKKDLYLQEAMNIITDMSVKS